MFGLKKMMMMKKKVLEPIEVGCLYAIRGNKPDPWGVKPSGLILTGKCIAEVTDVKDGWVRYSYFYNGKRCTSSDEVMLEKMFRTTYERINEEEE